MAPLASAAEQLFLWDGGISHLETNSNPNAYCVQFKLLLYSRIKKQKNVCHDQNAGREERGEMLRGRREAGPQRRGWLRADLSRRELAPRVSPRGRLRRRAHCASGET